MLINFVDATNDANHYTKPPPELGLVSFPVWLNYNLMQCQDECTALQMQSQQPPKHHIWTVSYVSNSPMSEVDRASVIFLSQVERDRPGVWWGYSPELWCVLRKYDIWFAFPVHTNHVTNSERSCGFTLEESRGCSVMRRTSAFL